MLKLLLFLLPICESDFLVWSVWMQRCLALLRTHLVCPMPLTAKDTVLPDSMFFDKEYHLNSIGIEHRTRQIISVLEQILREPASAITDKLRQRNALLID